MKNMYNKWQKAKKFSLKSITGQEFTFSLLLFTMILEVLASAIRKEKNNKVTQIRREENFLFIDNVIVYAENSV